ncbi:MAG: sulfatase [Bryobacteraceae bacterium]
MNRRTFLQTALHASALGLAAQTQSRPPNFVVIYADDLGYGDLSCYGATAHRTPRLDRMAQEGVRFTDFYVPTPYCAPSRASLLTGRYPFRNGMVFNPAPDSGVNDAGLRASEITIAEALKSKGYTTTCIGKWHLGHLPEFLPRTQGFDEYYGILYSNDMRPVQLVENERVAKYPVIQADLTREYTDRAIDFIERNRSKPFFLYLPHAMPHKPLAASERFYSYETPGSLYSDVIRELDFECGRILDTLKRLGLEENTLVVFASDNGPWFGGSTAGLRGMKASSWEGGIRVPMIARWPGRIPSGRVCREIAGVIDLFPTICGLAGVPLPSDRVLDGRDIFSLMTREGAKTPHEALFSMSGPNLVTVRSGKWKLAVRTPANGPQRLDPEAAAKWVDPRGPDGVTLIAQFEQARPDQYPGVHSGAAPKEMMLFDLEADPTEQKDVSDSHPEVVARLKKLFDEMDAQAARIERSERHGAGGIRRLQGGEMRYDRMPERPSN